MFVNLDRILAGAGRRGVEWEARELLDVAKEHAADGGGIVRFEICCAAERLGARPCRPRRQGEHLEARAIEGQQVFVDEAVARFDVGIERAFECRADGVVAIEADAAAVTGENEKEIERALIVAERGKEAVV